MLARALIFLACALPLTAHAGSRECAQSPGRLLELCVSVEAGRATWEVGRLGQPVIAPSTLGLSFAGEPAVRWTALTQARWSSVDRTWEQPWGEQRIIADRHSEMTVTLSGDTPLNREVVLTVRLFDDGVGFRYSYPSIPPDESVKVVADNTQYRTVGTNRAWWYPAWGQERDEYLYSETDARRITTTETPLTLKRDDGLYLSIHEAALVDFPSMLLTGDGAGTLTARLMPWPDGVLAQRTGPFSTPWRTILVGETPGNLADSRIELNLNEPNRLGDVSWVRPGKYVGVWWEMHLDRSTWGSGDRHGATTANVQRYMDFAAENGFDNVLVEGWNQGWDGEWIANGDAFRFAAPYPDFDIAAVAEYGKHRGVGLIGHHETAGAVTNYEAQIEEAMALYERYGVGAVKTGYVRHSGDIADQNGGLQWFAGQYMVRHHLQVAEIAARHHIAINAHEPVKDTGLRRTWPNMISREGARGQEFNAWGNPTNPPEHLTILPFTRLLAGPMDFTPGIFDIPRGGAELTRRVQSTLATQLAQYVVIYSPIQMAADLPENYQAHPDAFQFIKDVPTDWETSRTLQSEIGEYVVVARLQRGAADWYLGAITDENGRTLRQPLSFLEPGRRYEAQIYADGPEADYRTNPMSYVVSRQVVTSTDILPIVMRPGGGLAVRFRALP
ncbi:MAG TPA: glycoside hydrolase family 97 protein [Brevundimonas sp.]|jgi:alpha-glucosidase